MIVPLPTHATPHRPAESTAAAPEVRLDVRLGSGRATGYDLTRSEFLVGGGEGCDLRLPGSHIPAVLCQFLHANDGIRLRRLAPAFPILLNGQPLNGSNPILLKAGDRVAVGAADIVVNLNGAGHLRPTFHEVRQPAVTRESPSSAAEAEANRRERQALDDYRNQLAEQARELEADRVAWYRRRQEIEGEVRRIQESATAGTKLADRESWLQTREAEVAARERELSRVREELSEIRTNLFEQFRERRERIEQLQQAVDTASSTFEEQQRRAEADLDTRRSQLDDEARRLQDYVAAEVLRRVAELETEARRQRMEADVAYEARLRDLERQAALRRDQFAAELEAYHPQAAEREAERQRLAVASADVERQQQAIEQAKDELDRERRAFEAERNFHDEQRADSERLNAARGDELDRQYDRLRDERTGLEQERGKMSDDLQRLERWQAAVEDRQIQLDRRAAEIDDRLQQLTRDAVELEEQTKLGEVERAKLQDDAERLASRAAELEARGREQAERAAQLDAQQASLAIVRSKLDRRAEELHREAAALAADRARLLASQRDLDERMQDAERLRASLGTVRLDREEAERAMRERQSLLEATQNELRQREEQLSTESERLLELERQLDARSAEFAEQAAVLKAKTAHVLDLQQRLENDRAALLHREGSLAEADKVRSQFQEQLRKRAEELSQREKDIAANRATIADERLGLDRQRAEWAQSRESHEQSFVQRQQELAARETELTRQQQQLQSREEALARQVDRLRETGRTVAAGRKELFAAKQQWQDEAAAMQQRSAEAKRTWDGYRERLLAELEELKQQAPGLESKSNEAIERAKAARDILRGQLGELHGYASQTRDALDRLRADLRAEAERLKATEAELERARGDHRHAVAEFRAQVLDWQAQVGSLRNALQQGEERIDKKRAELEAASKKSDETAIQLAERLEQLRLDRDELSERRTQVERHLADLREWYRKKLRDLAADRSVDPNVTRISVHPAVVKLGGSVDGDELEPGDVRLGELLQSLELVDPESLADLLGEARRQRRSLRQVLLASGAITLYQLALIEAGNLDALALDRFRVIDRLRITPKEAIYRVHDPKRADAGPCILRVLGEAELADATHPDEYRQRFAASLGSPHPNLVATLELLEIQGRPAVLQELVTGLPGSEWPPFVSTPGLWLKLVAQSAAGIEAAHRLGLVHGRLTSDSFAVTPDGAVKVLGFADPPWLLSGTPASFDPLPGLDLRSLGQVATMWSQQTGKKRGRAGKAFPEALQDVLRRLEGDAETPMGDTAGRGEPYRSAAELVDELERLAEKYPCPAEAWNDLLRFAADPNGDVGLKKAG